MGQCLPAGFEQYPHGFVDDPNTRRLLTNDETNSSTVGTIANAGPAQPSSDTFYGTDTSSWTAAQNAAMMYIQEQQRNLITTLHNLHLDGSTDEMNASAPPSSALQTRSATSAMSINSLGEVEIMPAPWRQQPVQPPQPPQTRITTTRTSTSPSEMSSKQSIMPAAKRPSDAVSPRVGASGGADSKAAGHYKQLEFEHGSAHPPLPPPLVPDASSVYKLTEEDEDVCPTCLEEYTYENPKIIPLCGHAYHLACIYEWIERGSNFCPVCGHRMVFEESSALFELLQAN
eukprot:CAMPEP_0184699606 /NCGR_PEP_ID=MMETSP0313-20130426/5825_1 /TAXON_ID=2792 /ORGANISM="Porphyridium aerugineum, Strain SAG 1380-2" /LENGTH=286 /DNA_ID=CAMNT_0027158725 /DNA_START=227 /DNA_END=1087 /DNA_ORIENTATION=-